MTETSTFGKDFKRLRKVFDRLSSELNEGLLEDAVEIQSLLERLSAATTPIEEKERLATLYEVSQTLGASLDINEALSQVMDAVIQLTEAVRGFIMLADRDTGELDIQAARNFERRDLDQEEMQISRTVIEQVLQKGDGIVTSNAQTDSRFAETTSIVRYALRSILCVPLRVRGEIIGVVYVDNPAKSGLFDEEDRETLEALAAQAAVVIENARLYTKTDAALEQRIEELETLQRIDRELNTGLNLERVLELTLDWAIRRTGAEDGWIAIRSSDTPAFSIASGKGKGYTFTLPQDADIATFSPPLPELRNSNNNPSFQHLIVPIQREKEIVGILGVWRSEGAFSSEALPFLQRLAEHSAIAIENTRLYRAAQAANLAKSQFISFVSHEIRMPMTAICGYADLLRQGAAGPITDRQEQFLQTIRSNVDRMELLVSDLSDISRIETGRLEIIPAPLPIRDYLKETVENWVPQFHQKNQELKLDLPPDLPFVQADPGRLTQVLANLLSNANKYTPAGGTILVSAKELDDLIQISVSDDGIGISMADQADLFSQFFRSDDPAVRKQKGWGLGLHISRQLVSLMDGDIGFESKLDKGSTFWFTLPIVDS
jgi:signal transduction histidine kinase